MSIKAYEGLLFEACTIEQLVQDMTVAFKKLDELGSSHEAKFLAHQGAANFDKQWWASRSQPGASAQPIGDFIMPLWREMRQRQREILSSRERDPEVDSQIEIQVWLGKAGRLYGYVHSEVSGVRDYLIEHGFAKDFAYWNNSDRDETVTAADWRKRRTVWSFLTSAQAPKSFQFLNSPYLLPEPAAVAAQFPSKHVRAKKLAEQETYRLWQAEQGERPVSPTDSISDMLQDFWDFDEARKTPDNPWCKKYETCVAQLEAELPELSLS